MTGSEASDPAGALLLRHCDGDADAFGEFVASYQRPVYGYLVRCGVGDEVRDDLFQEVFARVHRAAPTYRPERPVRPWVFAITANVVRNHFRRVARAAPRGDASVDDRAPDAQEMLEARETAAWIEQAIAALPISQREVVVLCCVEQLAQADVAAVLAMPLNTVKTHLRRGRLALAQALTRRRAALRREVSR